MYWIGCVLIVLEHSIVPFDYIRKLAWSELAYLPFWTASI